MKRDGFDPRRWRRFGRSLRRREIAREAGEKPCPPVSELARFAAGYWSADRSPEDVELLRHAVFCDHCGRVLAALESRRLRWWPSRRVLAAAAVAAVAIAAVWPLAALFLSPPPPGPVMRRAQVVLAERLRSGAAAVRLRLGLARRARVLVWRLDPELSSRRVSPGAAEGGSCVAPRGEVLLPRDGGFFLCDPGSAFLVVADPEPARLPPEVLESRVETALEAARAGGPGTAADFTARARARLQALDPGLEVRCETVPSPGASPGGEAREGSGEPAAALMLRGGGGEAPPRPPRGACAVRSLRRPRAEAEGSAVWMLEAREGPAEVEEIEELEERWFRAAPFPWIVLGSPPPPEPLRAEARALLGEIEALEATWHGRSPPPAVRAAARGLRAAVLASGLRRVREAEGVLEEALAAFSSAGGEEAGRPHDSAPPGGSGDRGMHAWRAWRLLGRAAELTSRPELAAGPWQRALEIAEAAADSAAAGETRAAAARLEKRLGRLDEACEGFARLAADPRDLPRATLASVLCDSADIDRARLRFEVSLARYGEALARLEERGGAGAEESVAEPPGERGTEAEGSTSSLRAAIRRGRALALVGLRRFAEARREAQAALEVFAALGLDLWEVQARIALARALLGGGNLAGMREELAAIGEILDRVQPVAGDPASALFAAQCSRDAVALHEAACDIDGAVAALRRAASWCRVARRAEYYARTVQRIAEELARFGRLEGAREEVASLEAELEGGWASWAPPREVGAMRGRYELARAEVEMAAGRPAAAFGHLTRSRRIFQEAGHWRGDGEALVHDASLAARLGLWERVGADQLLYRNHRHRTLHGEALMRALEARARLAQGDLEGSRELVEEAIAVAAGFGGRELLWRFEVLRGGILEAAGDRAGAREAWSRALEQREEPEVAEEAELRLLLLELAGARREDLPGLLERLEASLEAAGRLSDPDRTARRHLARARALERLGDMEAAEAALESAEEALESSLRELSGGFPGDVLASRLASWHEVTTERLQLHLERCGGEGSRGLDRHSLEALRAVDRLRARALDGARFLAPARRRGTGALEERVAELRRRWSLVHYSPYLPPPERELAEEGLRCELFEAEVALRRELFTAAPSPGSWHPAEALEALEAGEALLATHAGGEEAHVLLFRRDRSRCWKVPVPVGELEARVGALLGEVARRGAGFEEPLDLVSRWLLGPGGELLRGVERLWVAPDPRLAGLPVGLLRLEDGRYLVEAAEVIFLPAPRHLPRGGGVAPRERAGRLADPEDVDLVAFADPASREGGSGAFWRLPGARREAQGAAALFPRSCVFVGARATEEAFVREAGRGRYLLVAAHAVSGGREPLLDAAVLLAERGAGTGEEGGLSRADGAAVGAADGEADGYLTALEVRGLDLRRVDLAVLSGCGSGRGRPRGPEGVQGLETAFLEAGAGAVLSSRWEVADDLAACLVVALFREIRAGRTPAAALREVQLGCLRGTLLSEGVERDRSHPFYWAGVALVEARPGDGGRLAESPQGP